jgi:uncharacterized protein (TIGR02145 family)
MSNDSTTEKLQELFDLHQSGALTKEEFNSLKSELLGLGDTSTTKVKTSSNLSDLHIAVPESIESLPNEVKNAEQHFEISNQSEVKLTKMKKKAFLLILSSGIIFTVIAILFIVQKKSTEVTDVDGNIYKTVKIGSQVWMAENLKVTKFSNGTSIPLVTNNKKWAHLTTPGFCWYNNDDTKNKSTYGALYNWYSVNTRKLCPEGWHVPSDSDWNILSTFLGGKSVAGGKLKENGTSHWRSPNVGATNETGFSAIPGGMRGVDSGDYMGISCSWWSTTKDPEVFEHIMIQNLRFDESNVSTGVGGMEVGFSVRCLKDN